ncbi:hydrogenase maturation protease [Neptuniibacter caesariensis]|uniref:Hydrogenase maturation protease n=1 Tax=Neptuniibacter caesariensis TaxID=207954 RepID=A0A7U8C7C4_NEPCE|nr:hydrogenase maturation protease [Neptuniibacter caesariensis]EAR62925.1 hypothetical protein MED92_07396 [Oceanospirillum sp. MED92] [Neptuniibacter caesariensis]
MSCAVVGLGSAHGDDQLGWLLVDMLETQAERINISAPGAELFAVLQQYEQIVVVDAAEIGLLPGEFRFIAEGAELLGSAQPHLSSHTLDLVQYWLLLGQLKIPEPKISLFLVQLKKCNAMQGLSPELERRMQVYKSALEQVLDNLLSSDIIRKNNSV